MRLPTRLHVVAALVAPFALLAAGCRSTTAGIADEAGSRSAGSATAAPAGAITVSAAASLAEPLKRIAEDFKRANPAVADVRFAFDSSSSLAKQSRDGASADVFASADQESMSSLVAQDLVIGQPQTFARNKLAIVVKKANPKNVKGLADLAGADVVSLCNAAAPCGRYASQALDKAGVSIPADKITRGQNARATLTAVAEGDADAGIVYTTDTSTADVEPVPIPDSENVIATYPIAALKTSTDPHAAKAFVDYVLGPEGQATLASAGFLPAG